MRRTNNNNNNSGSTAINNNNYYQPLQTLENENEDETIVTKTIKESVPPITIIKCQIDQLHELCKKSKISAYSIRKISIGLKLFCQTSEDFNKAVDSLRSGDKFEFFTHAYKTDRPYKALLFGLDKTDVSLLKNKLLSMGLDCLNVKLIHKSEPGRMDHIFYMVYFKKQSISLKELRQKYSVIEYLKVKWEYYKNKINKVTQCYNCQMFGHGSSHCAVKTFCSKCSGNHKTTECTANSFKCANCNGDHESSSPDCPSRIKYLEIKQRIANKNNRSPKRGNNDVRQSNVQSGSNQNGYNTSYPALHTGSPIPNSWANLNTSSNNNGDLFSFEEIKNITFELIHKLKSCKSKLDQLEVVSSIATKFLS